MNTPDITPGSYVPQDTLFVWALVNPAAPTLVGELRLSQLGVCAAERFAG